MQDKINSLFGGGRRGGNGGGAPGKAFAGFGLIAGIAFIVWLATGIYIVDAGTRGVIMRFGAYIEATMPGPHWHVPYPIEQVEIVNVEQRRFVEIGYRSGNGGQAGLTVDRESLMLTKDENIVSVQLAVQYQIDDPRKYLFNVRQPEAVLKQVAESAVREVIGKSEMDFVLKEGRAEVVSRVKIAMQSILDEYDSGMRVSDVNLQDAQPPEEVQGAFSDAIKAREDKERLKNEAETYANEVIPVARGRAARQTQEAQAYKESLVAKAQGEASRFTALLKEYKRAPEVTRQRLYLETMETVLNRTNKVIVDSDNSNNLMYLPLDQLMKQNAGKRTSGANVSDAVSGTSPNKAPTRPVRRPRETR